MSSAGKELEVKLYLSNLKVFQARLDSLGACLYQTRTIETNLRFDTPDGELRRNLQVLRLRQDKVGRLTYKGPAEELGGVRSRREIEFTVSDFKAARSLLEALGYQLSLIYEKYRAVYELEGVLVSLDELPYGDFTELEGPDPESIKEVAQKLKVKWDRRIPESYTDLFERLRASQGFAFRDLTFDNFKGIQLTAEDLNVKPADG